MTTDAAFAERLSTYGRLLENEWLSKHTTMRLGGPARWFLSVLNPSMIPELLTWLEEQRIPWAPLAGGSNTVASETGFAGVVIVPAFSTMKLGLDGTVTADAGCITALFARKVTEAGWSGWEWGVGLPGTIGGALVGNAGCYGGETRDHLVSVEGWSVDDRVLKIRSEEECLFGYRESRFKHERFFVLRGTWKVSPSVDQAASLAMMRTILQKRKEEQPLGTASAGCLFKNVEADEGLMARIEKLYGPIPAAARTLRRIPAGWLIEHVGLKNMSCGGMRISDRHANFAIQNTAATATDWMNLRDTTQKKIFEETGILLETEVRTLSILAPARM